MDPYASEGSESLGFDPCRQGVRCGARAGDGDGAIGAVSTNRFACFARVGADVVYHAARVSSTGACFPCAKLPYRGGWVEREATPGIRVAPHARADHIRTPFPAPPLPPQARPLISLGGSVRV